MLKRIVALAIICAALALPGSAREGFGWSKKGVNIDKTKPPAVNISGTRMNVFVNAEKTRKTDKAKDLRDLTEKAILEGNKQLEASPHGDVNVSIALDRLDTVKHNESKVDYDSQKTKDKNGKTTYVSVPVTKNFTRVAAEIGGTYEITDAKGRVIDAGDIDRKFNEDYEYGAPSDEKLESALLQGAANTIAARIVPTKQRTKLILPKGSFEQFIPLAESGAWDRYLQGLESVRPMGDRGSDAYRQYAFGVAKEALAYSEPDPKKGLELLRAAAEHYRTAAADNKEEKIFSEAYTGLLSAARAPIARVEESIKAYEAWTSGPTPPRAATASAAAPAKTLRNQNVIEMSSAGLSDENIMLAIDSAERKEFDTTPEGLIALSKAGVSKNVIAHIQKSVPK